MAKKLETFVGSHTWLSECLYCESEIGLFQYNIC